MKTLIEIFNISQYDNWVKPDDENLQIEYKYEYLKNIETKHGELFKSFFNFKKAVLRSPVVELTSELDKKIDNRSHCRTIENLKQLVGTYVYPRDIDKIIKGFQNNDKIPAPIILKFNDGYMRILGGNSRLNVAEIMGVPMKVIIVNIGVKS